MKTKILIIVFLLISNCQAVSHNFQIFDNTINEYLKKSNEALEKDVKEIEDPLSLITLALRNAENLKKVVNPKNYKDKSSTIYLTNFFENIITGVLKLFLCISCYAIEDEEIASRIDDKYIAIINKSIKELPFIEKDIIDKCCKDALKNCVNKIESELKTGNKKFDPTIITKYLKQNFKFFYLDLQRMRVNGLKDYNVDINEIINYDIRPFQINSLKGAEKTIEVVNHCPLNC